ncbi:hypothetical protein [Rhodoplanes azumiensis]|uniref:Protein phosphatase 2C-like protein n=1 Tax=Rhodoplanes azumiensis TaxID=1897628 RepID=A0ABW5AL59_9BRAD
MRRVRAWSVPKEPEVPSENEDAFAANAAATAFAVCDGATESFASGRWARALAAAFVAHAPLDRTLLAGARATYEQSFDMRKWPPYRRNAYRRGSYAALVGLMLWPKEHLYAIQAIGDSICVVAEGAPAGAADTAGEGDGTANGAGAGPTLVRSFPLSTPAAFERRPVLLSTADHTNVVDGVHLLDQSGIWTVGRYTPHARTAFCLMTDALGAWLLGDAAARLARLQAIDSQTAFADLVIAERAAGRLRRDDTTLMIVETG